MNRKGFTLVAVLTMSFVIGAAAMSLWNMANLDARIAGNNYKLSQTKFAAQSGISHFLALNLDVADAYEGIVIPITSLTRSCAYIVEIYRTEDGKTVILSKGLYRKGSRTIFSYPIRAAIEKW